MTYVKQLEDYEEAVMQKRLEEMPEAGDWIGARTLALGSLL
jgi:hypothetical protein